MKNRYEMKPKSTLGLHLITKRLGSCSAEQTCFSYCESTLGSTLTLRST